MSKQLPTPVLETDERLHQILQITPFSRHLNPSNVYRARESFLCGAHAPPFVYEPLLSADEILKTLDVLNPGDDHPACQLLKNKIHDLRLLVLALRDRTSHAFSRLNEWNAWLPTSEILALRFSNEKHAEGRANRSAAELITYLEEALEVRGLRKWRVVTDTTMSARVLVDGAKCLLRVNPQAKFKTNDLKRLVVHEIDVHVSRSYNGAQQPLRIFQTGLHRALHTEEGLAMLSEQRAGVQDRGSLQRQTIVVQAIIRAKELGFRQLFMELKEAHGPGLAWNICLRVKRGLSNPENPGVYAKDSVYLSGWWQLSRWVEAGNSIEDLYVGVVGMDDPVREWIDQGWLSLGDSPKSWT